MQGTSTPALGDLIITGHSRGYDFLEPLAHSRRDPAMAQGALAHLARIGAFDTTYRGDVDAWLDWLTLNPRLRVDVAYRPVGKTATVGDEFFRHRRARLTVTRAEEIHCAVPATRLATLLQAVAPVGGAATSEAMKDAFDEALDEAPDEAVDDALDEAVDDALDEALDDAVDVEHHPDLSAVLTLEDR